VIRFPLPSHENAGGFLVEDSGDEQKSLTQLEAVGARPSVRLALVAMVLASGLACRWPQAPHAQVAQPDLFKQHIDALYLASKELEGLAIVSKGNAERLRPLVEKCHFLYLVANDFAVGPDDQKLATAFGDALPSMRVIFYEAMNAASWGATARSSTSSGPQKVALEQSNFHIDKSVAALEQTRERLGKAARLYVTHYRDRSSMQ